MDDFHAQLGLFFSSHCGLFPLGRVVRDCAAQWHQCLSTAVAPVCPVNHPIGYLLFCFCIFFSLLSSIDRWMLLIHKKIYLSSYIALFVCLFVVCFIRVTGILFQHGCVVFGLVLGF